MKAPVPKPLLMLAGVPVVVRTLKVFEACAAVDSSIVIVPEEYLADYKTVVAAAGLRKVKAVIAGGATRTGSVREGLRALDADTGMVIVQDAVRPFVTETMIVKGIAVAGKVKAAVAAVPVKSTLKVVAPVTDLVESTLDRSLVWQVQTPQVFDRALLEEAYAAEGDATDDAGMVERIGAVVQVFMGCYRNIKITTPEDMEVAEVFVRTNERNGVPHVTACRG